MNEDGTRPDPAAAPVSHGVRPAPASIERTAHLAGERYVIQHCNQGALGVVEDDISPKPPLSTESAASVRDAAVAMLRHTVGYLPVVDDGRLVAIVSMRDLWQRLPRTTEPRPDHDE
ncbi:MAG TPA: CBS domain-containing protein [Mycobacterium sp.]|jgi:CBS domain-containing protein|nr:CBS domain-containing protein [Mycobacterium sp.]